MYSMYETVGEKEIQQFDLDLSVVFVIFGFVSIDSVNKNALVITFTVLV